MRALLAALAIAAASAAAAQEPSGCDTFRWPVAAESRALSGEVAAVANGAELQPGPQGHAVALVPLEAAGLAAPPERVRGGESPNAAFVRYPAPPVSGTVQVTLDQAAWIDLVQDGRFVRPSAFSGASGCPGVRKTVRFVIDARPVVLQFSGTGMERVRFVVASPQP